MSKPKSINFKELLEKNKDPDYVVSCLSLLTPLEKSIVLVLHSKQSALNIKQIQNELILNLIYFLQRWGQGDSEYGNEMDNAMKNKVKLLPYYDFTPEDLGTLEYNLSRFKNETQMPKLKGQKTKGVSFSCLDTSQEGLNFYKKRLTETNISYPSFEKIESDLKELQRNELIIKRETSDKKSKGLWGVNPLIDFYLKKTDFSLYNEKFNPKNKKVPL